ncbi:MAG TPA: hypothetical protein VH853_06890 [Polyangia bacterium]|nr:hypothetical protein [Polyangia bacterium]
MLAALAHSSDEQLSREMKISRGPLLRIAAGLPVRQGTIELARIRFGVPATGESDV